MSSQRRLDGGHADASQIRHPAKLRVLIVDSNPDAADSLALLAQLWGHHPRVASSTADALEAADEFKPVVVISELVLPRHDGYELARNLRERHPNVLLIALTGLGRDVDRVRTREAGFNLHLVKPADPCDIEYLLRHHAALQSLLLEGVPLAICERRVKDCPLVGVGEASRRALARGRE